VKGTSDRPWSIDELLDRAVAAMNRGDRAAAHQLAGAVLAADTANRDATDLLAEAESGSEPGGELRRASLLFADLVGSTALSARHDPELYRQVIRRYKALCRDIIEVRYGGHISHVAGDGLFAVFGLPTPHENDAARAVLAGLDIVAELPALSADLRRVVGDRLDARVAVHKGLVFLDAGDDDVYGLAANVVARLHGLARPGTVVVSDAVHDIVGSLFETVAEPAQRVKGVEAPLRPHRVVAPRPEAPDRGRRWEAPLVDRADELAALRALWDDVRTGGGDRPRGLHLSGEAGVGKSRLAAVLVDEVLVGGGRYLQLLGSPLHAEASFHPLRALVDSRCGFGRGAATDQRLSRLRHELARVGLPADELVPLLAPVIDLTPAAGYRPAQAEGRKLRDAIADAAARYVLACLEPGPALLVVDDVHWCDQATIDVAARVLATGPADVMVVTTSRDPAPPALSGLAPLPLAPLDAEASEDLVVALDPGLDPVRRAELVERSDGVPLYLEELVRASGLPAPGPGIIDLRDPVPAGDVPDVLYEPLVARLHASAAGVQVACAAAAIGREVDRRILGHVVDLTEAELDDALTSLLADLILERAAPDEPFDGATEGDCRYRFHHELLREVAYGLQPITRRREMHGRVADALAAEAGETDVVDWHAVAGHYDAAGRVVDAVDAYERAADRVRRLGVLPEARGFLARAIELVATLPDSGARRSREVALRLRRGFLAVSAEGACSPDAVQDYERCLEITRPDTASDELFGTLYAMWAHYMSRGELARADQIDEMLRSALTGEREFYGPDIDAAWSAVRWFAGDFAEAQAGLRAAADSFVARGRRPNDAATWYQPTDAHSSTECLLALATFMVGDDGAPRHFARARVIAESLEFPQGAYSAANSLSYEAWLRLEEGDLAAASRAVDQLGALADRHGFEVWDLVAATQQAEVRAAEAIRAQPGDRAVLAAHAGTLEQFCSLWRGLDMGLFLPSHMATTGRARAAAGDHAGALALFDEALRFAGDTRMHFYDAELLRLRAPLTGEDTCSELHKALALARRQGAVPFEVRIACDLRRIDPSTAGVLAEALVRCAPGADYPELAAARALAATPV
jgi:class 3 adenylate cyclase